MRRLLAEGSALMLGTGVNGVAAYLFIALGTRAYGAEGFAPVSVLWTFWAVSVAALTFPVQHWIIRRIRLDGHDGGVRAAIPHLTGMMLTVIAPQVLAAWALGSDLFRDERLVWPGLVGAIALGSAWIGLVRGGLAGHRRFYAVAAIVAGENLLRLVAGLATLHWSDDVIWYGVALALGPLISLIWLDALPLRGRARSRGPTFGFLGGVAGGILIAQIVLNAGPAVLSLLGGESAEITALFAGLALFRAPYLLALGMAPRITGPLTGLVAGRDLGRLRQITRLIGITTVVGTALGSAFSYLIGTELLALIFGTDVILAPPVVAGVAAGNLLALGTLALTLVLIARSGSATISLSWIAALGVGLATLLLSPGALLHRVVVAFVASELTALAWMWFAQMQWSLQAAHPEAGSSVTRGIP